MEEILKFIEMENLVKTPTTYTTTPLEIPFELNYQDYIKFAEEDIKEETNRALVNAISNIKRAIDCRVESLLYIFGIYKIAKKRKLEFSNKN
jgi:hypothetical protein